VCIKSVEQDPGSTSLTEGAGCTDALSPNMSSLEEILGPTADTVRMMGMADGYKTSFLTDDGSNLIRKKRR